MSQSAKDIKTRIRRSSRQLRQNISTREAKQAETAVCKILSQLSHYQTSDNIASFLAFDGEIGTHQINQQIINDKNLAYLPKLKPWPPNRLWFMPYSQNTRMIKNRFGIPEVDLPVSRAIRPSHLDIILMPLVAFDESGNRLGMGGGFYDATLAHLSSMDKKPVCLGLAYEKQKVENIPAETWDFPIDGVITEQKVYWFSK